MFNSVYSEDLSAYYDMRSIVLSDSALKHEKCYLKRFDKFICNSVDEKGRLQEKIINKWLAGLSNKSSSIENEVIVIRQFLKYLALSGEKVYLPVIPKVRDDYVPYIFSDEEIHKIYSSADNITLTTGRTDPYVVIEFPVIIRLLLACGLRIGETLNLKVDDVDFENGILTMINTKGDKHRYVPMTTLMTSILQKYCMVMELINKKEAFLFPSSFKEGHISDRTVKHRFEKILRDNGISADNRRKQERGPCLHCLRHVFAFRSFQKAERAGIHLDDAIPYLSIYLGHDSLDETSKYLKFSSEMFPEAVDDFGEYMNDILPEVTF